MKKLLTKPPLSAILIERQVRSLTGQVKMQVWRNWQTRMVQVHMSASSCRFKSCHLHQKIQRDPCGQAGFFDFRTGLELIRVPVSYTKTGRHWKGSAVFYFFTIHFSLHCSVLHRLAVRRESYVLPTPWSPLPRRSVRGRAPLALAHPSRKFTKR